MDAAGMTSRTLPLGLPLGLPLRVAPPPAPVGVGVGVPRVGVGVGVGVVTELVGAHVPLGFLTIRARATGVAAAATCTYIKGVYRAQQRAQVSIPGWVPALPVYGHYRLSSLSLSRSLSILCTVPAPVPVCACACACVSRHLGVVNLGVVVDDATGSGPYSPAVLVHAYRE